MRNCLSLCHSFFYKYTHEIRLNKIFGAESFVFRFAIQKLKDIPLVLYGCATWSLTLREERRLRVFENRLQRRIFGHRRDEVTGE